MPFTFLILGIVLLIAATRGTHEKLLELLKDDFSGSPSFLPWVFSILVLGALGYVDKLRTISRAFLILVLVGLFLSNGGFFAKLEEALPEVFNRGAAKQ